MQLKTRSGGNKHREKPKNSCLQLDPYSDDEEDETVLPLGSWPALKCGPFSAVRLLGLTGRKIGYDRIAGCARSLLGDSFFLDAHLTLRPIAGQLSRTPSAQGETDEQSARRAALKYYDRRAA